MNPQPFADEMIPLLEQRVLPWWKRHGMEHVAASAQTLKEFRAQSLPEKMSATVKKRATRQGLAKRRRQHGNSFIEAWPDDGQRSLRYPALVCALQGQADLHIADYAVHCPENHFLFLRPGVPQPDASKPHLIGGDPAQRYCEVLWFVIHPGTNCVTTQVCCSEGDKHWPRNNLGFCMVSRREVVNFFEAFTREMIEMAPGDSEPAAAMFEAFLLLYIRELKAGRFHRAGKNDAQTTDHSETSIAEAKRYINSHLRLHLTTDSVAKAVFMSRTHFMRCFQQEAGQTFHEYLTAQRLDEARRLLREGSWSLSNVSRWVGLSPSRMRALFHERHGVSPREFQNSYKENEAK